MSEKGNDSRRETIVEDDSGNSARDWEIFDILTKDVSIRKQN